MPGRWRADGDWVSDLSHTRRIMPFLMERRSESTVYFEQEIDPSVGDKFLAEFRSGPGERHATWLHLVLWAAAATLDERPRLNRFVAARRIFQRRGIWVSFSAKKAKEDGSPIIVVKKQLDPAWSFAELVRQIDTGIQEGRSPARTATDVELSLLFKLPTVVVGMIARVLYGLARRGWMPGVWLRSDPFHASLFVASLGSIGMDAGFHHLYEVGNIPIFLTLGAVRDRVRVGPDGRPEVRPVLTLRYSFDERIEDGLYCANALDRIRARLEDPRSFGLGG